MAIWDLLLTERAILAALGPLAGDCATGNVIATATGADVVLPPFTYGVPLIGGKFFYDRMLRVESTAPINVAAVGPTVTSAGTSVLVRAVCGGSGGNLPEGTRVLWQPTPTGIAPRGTVAASGLTGGITQDVQGRCARVVSFRTLGAEAQGGVTAAIWEAQGTGFPALVLAYRGDRRVAARSIASAQIEHLWRVHIVCADYLDNDERAIEALLLIDAVRDVLEGLADAYGDIFSGVPCEVGNVTPLAFSPNSHVYGIDLTTTDAPRRTDVRLTDGVSWQPWATARIQMTVPAAPPLDEKAVVDVTAEET